MPRSPCAALMVCTALAIDAFDVTSACAFRQSSALLGYAESPRTWKSTRRTLNSHQLARRVLRGGRGSEDTLSHGHDPTAGSRRTTGMLATAASSTSARRPRMYTCAPLSGPGSETSASAETWLLRAEPAGRLT
jgi:hypothetical protein